MRARMPTNPHIAVVSSNSPAPTPVYGNSRTPPRPPLAWWIKLLPRRWTQAFRGSVLTSELPSATTPSKGVSVGRRNLAETMVGYGKPSHRAR